MTYQFSVFSFTEREIDQIVRLTQMYSQGWLLPVKRSTLSKQVIEYALYWNLLEENKGRLFIPRQGRMVPLYDLPIEALWRMVAPMLSQEHEQTGYSIVNHPGWALLNIYHQHDRFASERDLEEKEAILAKLSQHHYINFQMAGTTWCIYREKEVA